MSWSKTKKVLESFLAPDLIGKVVYRQSGYRYTKEKPAMNCLLVNQVEVFNTTTVHSGISWYDSEMDIKKDPRYQLSVTPVELESFRNQVDSQIPEHRLLVMAEHRQLAELAKNIFYAQNQLFKSDFQSVAREFLGESIEKSLKSDVILLNILALIDRRVGKKRLIEMKAHFARKHPIVYYFYELRTR